MPPSTQVDGATSYTASVTAPNGAVSDYGDVGAGGASLWVPYVGNGTYTVEGPGLGHRAVQGQKPRLLASDKASAGRGQGLRSGWPRGRRDGRHRHKRGNRHHGYDWHDWHDRAHGDHRPDRQTSGPTGTTGGPPEPCPPPPTAGPTGPTAPTGSSGSTGATISGTQAGIAGLASQGEVPEAARLPCPPSGTTSGG